MIPFVKNLIIGNVLVIYYVLLVNQVVFFLKDDRQKHYVPTSQREKLWNFLKTITTWMNDVEKSIESSIGTWIRNSSTSIKIDRIKISASNINSPIQKETLRLGMMEFAAVTMQANDIQSNYLDNIVSFYAN